MDKNLVYMAISAAIDCENIWMSNRDVIINAIPAEFDEKTVKQEQIMGYVEKFVDSIKPHSIIASNFPYCCLTENDEVYQLFWTLYFYIAVGFARNDRPMYRLCEFIDQIFSGNELPESIKTAMRNQNTN